MSTNKELTEQQASALYHYIKYQGITKETVELNRLMCGMDKTLMVGHWTMPGSDWEIDMLLKPNWLVRKATRILLGWVWVDA